MNNEVDEAIYEHKEKKNKNKLKRFYVYTNEEEYSQIIFWLRDTPLSMSEYVKRKILRQKIPTYNEKKYYQCLNNLDSDLGRIAGLIKAIQTNKEKFVGLYGNKLNLKMSKILLLILENKLLINNFLDNDESKNIF